ncbi:MAG: flagellar assembly peptidoglycan hydrolase FlgJ, partial [Proteobacteria bacterium]|nr:flagellar assembly peptidoglycan hydrolase FlgJ [Pseudomonadota bacterium]
TMNSGLLESQNEKVYLSMFDQQLSQSLSGRGLGLADAMLAQLQRTMAATGSADLPDSPQGMPGLKPQARAAAVGSGVPVMPVPRQATGADLSIYQANGGPSPGAVASLQDHVDQFVSRMGPSAQAASSASGVPAPLILAQAALESGWGKREIRGEDGAQSFNLFGIKADRSWKGPTVEVTTTEYVDGEPQKVRAKFRAYGSYDEAFADYARFITRNPRYADVLATDDPAQAAHGLQRAGYATDPQYGSKLVRIMQKFS